MVADRYGLALSTGSQAAGDAYVAGCDRMLEGTAGVRRHLDGAIAADPHFALAHVALARGLFLEAELKVAREAAARARELAAAASVRERSHVNAIALAIEGRVPDALAATRAHLADYPRDAMVLAPATGVFGLIGFSGRQGRETELYELLRALAPAYGDDWWFLSMLAFAACECGRLDEASALIDRSVDSNPRSAHGAHIKVHVLYETGGARKGCEYLDAWMPGFDRAGLMHCHLSWHVALFSLELGRLERAWEVYRTAVHPGGAWGPPLNVATDTVAFLWRSELAGQPRQPQLWREAKAYAQRLFPRAGVPFADVHTAVACAANDDFAALEKLVGEMRERLAAGKLPPGGVVATLAEAFAAYARGDWNGSIRLFEQALPETVRIGGSRAQRDLVELTLLAAYLRAERPEAARALIAGRLDRRPAVVVAGFQT